MNDDDISLDDISLSEALKAMRDYAYGPGDNEMQHIHADALIAKMLLRLIDREDTGLDDEDRALLRQIVNVYNDGPSRWWYA